MKKSKSRTKRRDRSRSRSDDSKSKRSKPRSKSREAEKTKNTKATPRKTRWQADDKKDSSKKAHIPEPAVKKEKSGPPPRIKDFLHDKEKIVDLLFQTVTGAALQELIPDYLKKHPKEELKKLCLEQIKSMSDEVIQQIISGKLESSNKDEEKETEKEQNLKPEQPSLSKENTEEKVRQEPEKKPEESLTLDVDDKLSRTVSDSQKLDKNEQKTAENIENQIPLVIKDEVAKDVLKPERDAELLELEMRARAIRSLLKAKTQSSANEEEASRKEDKK